MIRTTADNSHSRLLHLLQIGAFAFIILWGIRASSEVLGPLLLSVMLAYAVLPFPVVEGGEVFMECAENTELPGFGFCGRRKLHFGEA